MIGVFPSFGSQTSKLKCCLSILESEYLVVSQSMRSLIVLHGLATEMAEQFNIPSEIRCSVYCTLFEDKNGAVMLISPKAHQQDNVRPHQMASIWDVIKRGDIKIIKVESAEQRANYPNKRLICEIFKSI
jgi:hypothetical protein